MIRKIVETSAVKFSINPETGDLEIESQVGEQIIPSADVGPLLNILLIEWENQKESIKLREGGAMTKLRNKIWTCK